MKFEVEKSPKRRRVYIETDRVVDRVVAGLLFLVLGGLIAPEVPTTAVQLVRHLL